jgi:curved DNA-binding protein CbpA
MDPYLELEVSFDATDEEIKSQYRALAMIHHPDKGGDEEKFKRIKEAYEILSDPIRRKAYELSGNAETNLQIRNAALDHIAQMMGQIVPQFNSEADDLFAIMREEIIKIRQSMVENTNTCVGFIANLQKVMIRVNAKHDKQNIMIDLLQKQIDFRNREHEDFAQRIKICDLEMEILKDYEYGLVERIQLPGN